MSELVVVSIQCWQAHHIIGGSLLTVLLCWYHASGSTLHVSTDLKQERAIYMAKSCQIYMCHDQLKWISYDLFAVSGWIPHILWPFFMAVLPPGLLKTLWDRGSQVSQVAMTAGSSGSWQLGQLMIRTG